MTNKGRGRIFSLFQITGKYTYQSFCVKTFRAHPYSLVREENQKQSLLISQTRGGFLLENVF